MYYIGLDAGGTKTALYAASKRRHKVFETTGEGINFWRIEEGHAIEILTDLIQKAQSHFKEELGAICGGFAGASRVKVMQQVAQSLQDTFKVPVDFMSDAVVTLEGAFGSESGVMAVVGTGSNVLGKTRIGTIVQTGGWGWMIGDEGSGMRMALEALSLVAKAIDNEVNTPLRSTAQAFFGFFDREGLLNVVYRSNAQLQSFAPHLIAVAEAGDREAQWLLQHHAQEIAAQIVRLWHKHPDLSPRLAFSGGLIRKNPFFKHLVEGAVRSIATHPIMLVEPLYPPTIGAWQLAQRMHPKR